MQVRQWLASVLPPGERVVGLRPMAGATSSAVHAVTTEDGRGLRRRLVLRRYMNGEWLAREPDLAEHEARVLSLLAPTDVRAPELVAVDARGASCDVPAVLMTRLAGRPRRRPDLRQLAEVLPVVHAVRVPRDAPIRPYSPYYVDRDLRPPLWTSRPEAWERAIDVNRGPPPDEPAVFVHRDYHPGNLLWSGGQVTGVVDWVNASAGGGGADVGHCRANLCDFGHDVADRFLDLWLQVVGADSYHPYWDIVAAVGFLSEHSALPVQPHQLDDFVARAVARL